MKILFRLFSAVALVASLVTFGCHSAHVDVTVENRSGEMVRLLEVTYPSASFGANSLTVGAILHNRIQLRGEGAVKVLFTNSKGQSVEVTGPLVVEKQSGALRIVLLADGKADFQPDMNTP